MAERDPYAELPDNDTAVADDDPYAGLPDAPKSRVASAVDTAVDIGDRAIRTGIQGLKQTGPLAPIIRGIDQQFNITKGMDERQQRNDQARAAESGTYAQGDVRAGALGSMRKQDIARDKEKAKTAPAYKNRREAVDDAVNMIDEGANEEKVYERFAAIGIKPEEIKAEADRRAPMGPPQTFEPQDPEAAVTGTIGQPEQGRIARGIDTGVTALERGYKQAQRSGNILKSQLPGGSAEVASRRVAEANRTIPAYSDDVSAAIEKMAKSKTMGEAVTAAAESPGAFLAVLAESLVASSPSLLAIPATAVGGPAAGFAAASTASFAMGFGASIEEFLTEKGMNPRDPRDIYRALTDPTLMAEARDHATRYNVPVALFDGLSMVMANKVLGPVVKKIEAGTLKGGKAIGAAGAATIAEGGIQGGIGAIGDLSGQYVSGKDYDPFSALAEFGAEFIGAPKEIAANMLYAARNQQGEAPVGRGIDGQPPPDGAGPAPTIADLERIETDDGPAFRTPSGAIVSESQWNDAPPDRQAMWMQPAEGEVSADVPRETEQDQAAAIAADVQLHRNESVRLEAEAERLRAEGQVTQAETLRIRALSLAELADKIEAANGISEQSLTPGIKVEEIQGARAPLEPTERMQELERLAEVTQDPTVKKDLLQKLKAERQAQEQATKNEATADAYDRAALETEDQALAAELKKKAAALRKPERPSTRGITVREEPVEEAEARGAGEVERRKDAATRKKYEEMSPEELRQELLTSPVTKLPNRRAYDEAPKKKVQTSIDVDSLKWVNDNMGHPAGDEMLRKVGEAIKESGADGFHLSGDEFVIQSETPEQATAAMRKIRKILASATVSHTKPDGTVLTKKGIGLSHGSGSSVNEAESKLQQNKSERARRGVRPERGAEPRGVVKEAPGSGQATDGAGKRQLGRVPEGDGRGVSEGQVEINTTPLWQKRSGLTLADAPSAAKIRTALAADQAAVMRAAERHPDDEAAFLRTVQEIIDASTQEKPSADAGRGRADDVAAAGPAVRRAEAGERQPDRQETRPEGQEAARDVQQDGQPGQPGTDLASRSGRQQPRAERDQAAGDLASRSRRDEMSWEDVELGERGDVFVAGNFMLDPVRELEVGTGFGGELMLGHAASVAPGNRVVRYQIAGRDGRAIGRVDLQLDPQGNVVALHDISVQNQGQGVGRQVVGSLLANFDTLQILDIVPTARAFWEKLGVGAIDVYGNATLDWTSFARATARQPGRVSPEGGRGSAQRPAVQGGPQARQARQDLAALWYSPLQRAIEGITTKQASPQQWLNTITALQSKGVKADEIEFSGVKEWLSTRDDGKVSRDDLLAFLRENGVRVDERFFGANIKEMAKQRRDYIITTYEKEQLDRLSRNELSEDEVDQYVADFASSLNKQDTEEGMLDVMTSETGWTRDEAVEIFTDADESAMSLSDSPQYAQYVLPGGRNYREILLTLPSLGKAEQTRQQLLEMLGKPTQSTDPQFVARMAGYDDLEPGYTAFIYEKAHNSYLIKTPAGKYWVPTPNGDHTFNSQVDAELYLARWVSEEFDMAIGRDDTFMSSHWGVPNIIAHVRFDERTDADGKKVLFIQEIQSDWAQIGKRRGFRKVWKLPDNYEVVRDPERFADYTIPNAWFVVDENGDVVGDGPTREAAIQSYRELDAGQGTPVGSLGETGVPAAPFVQKTEAWTGLALKRVIRYAAENGFDRVAWTTGDQQNERYKLSTQVESIDYHKNEEGTYGLWAQPKGTSTVPVPPQRTLALGIPADKLEDYVGKELAQRIINGDGRRDSYKGRTRLAGLDLEVGGKGMRAFYDKIVPNVANDVLRKLGGGKVGQVALFAKQNDFDLDEIGNATEAELAAGGAGLTQPGFDITPAMRELAMQGMPLFSRRQPRLGMGEQLASVRAALDDAFGKPLIDGLIRAGILRLEYSWQNKRALARDPSVRALNSEGDERGPGASLFLDRIRAADAPALLMHEIGEHYGLPRMLGHDGYQKVLDGIRRAYMKNDAETVAAWDLVKRDYTNEDGTMMVPEGSDNFIREVAAAMVEKGVERGWIREMLDAIRSWLTRTFGVDVDKVDGNLLRGLATSALRQSAAGMLPRTSQFTADRAGSASRSMSIEAERISPRAPTAVKRTEDPLTQDLQPDLQTMMRDPEVFEHNLALLTGLDDIRVDPNSTPAQQAEQVVAHFTSNILALHDAMRADDRERSKEWYVGGNRIAHRLGARFGVPPRQVAAVIAALSPQRDWFTNVSLAERFLSAVYEHADDPWTPAMLDAINRPDPKGNPGWGQKISRAERSRIIGKTLREVWGTGSAEELLSAAHWVRAWDEATNPNMYRVITPEGDFMSQWDMSGKGPMPIRAGSFVFYVKALKLMANDSRENISNIIGADHKVRSFYNNIIAPHSRTGDVTIDTHAMAAAHWLPLGSSDDVVRQGFGGGNVGRPASRSSTISGISGNYAFYAEAYRRAAAARGILPREMQSITWEAVRGLFRPEQKASLKTSAATIWARYGRGEIDENQARQETLDVAGRIARPKWAEPAAGDSQATEASTYGSQLPEAGAPRGSAAPDSSRDDGRGAGGTEDLASRKAAGVWNRGRKEPRGGSIPVPESLIRRAPNTLQSIDAAVGAAGINELLANSPFDNAEYSNGRITGAVATTDAVRGYGIGARRGSAVTPEAFVEWLNSADAVEGIADQDYLRLVEKARGAVGQDLAAKSRALPQPPSNSSQLDAETNFQILQRKLFDRFNRVRQLQRERRPGIADDKNIVQADTLYYGRAQYEGDELERKFIEPLGEALKEAKKLGLTVRDADDYLMAMHAPERNRVIAQRNPNMPDGGSGLTNRQAAQILAKYDPKKTAALDKIAQIVYRMNEDRLLRQETSGLISQQMAAALRSQYKNYVPLKTLDEEGAVMGMGRGYELRNSGIEMAFGRQSKAGSPIASSIMDAARAVVMSEKAKVDRVIWELANDPDVIDVMTPVDDANAAQHFSRQRLNPKTGQIETVADTNWRSREDVVKLRVDGEEKYVWVRDDILRDQLRKVASLADPGPVLRSLGRVTSTIGRLLTEFNPAFTLPNAVRDAIGGVIKSNGIERVSPLRVAAGIPAAWKAIVDFKRDANTPGGRMYRDFQQDGAKTGAYGITDVADTMHRLERLGAELGYPGKERGITTKLMHGLNDLAKFVGHANEVVEYATRLSLYSEARRVGYSRKQAAVWAKELTVNFNRSGEYGRTMNSIFVFANAALQGLYGAIMFGKSNKVKAALLGLVVLGAITQAFNEAYGGDDEDTDEKNINTISDHTLDNNATVLIPGSANGIKIPLPPEFSFLYAMGRRAYRAMSQGNYGKEAAGIVGAFLGSTLPLRAPDASSTPLSVMKALTPTAVSPFMDIAVNEDFRGAPIVPNQREKDAPQPWPVLARSQTSDVSKAIASFVNTATGGDLVEPGGAQKAFGPFVSPEAMDHVVGFYTGGLGQFALQSKNLVRAVGGDEKAVEINRIPIANRFVFTQPIGYVGRRYRELASDFQYAIARQRDGSTDRVKDEVLAALPAYRGAERQLGPLFKQLRAAGEEGDKAREEELRAQIRAVQTNVLKAYNEARPR